MTKEESITLATELLSNPNNKIAREAASFLAGDDTSEQELIEALARGLYNQLRETPFHPAR